MDGGADQYRRFLTGDKNGMTEIIKDYKDGLIFYLNGIVGDLQTAEDLAEDTFVKLVVKKPHFSGKCSFKTWLYAIGRNLALDHLRGTSKMAPLPEDDYAGMAVTEESIEQTYLREEAKITVHRALAKLKPEYRQVLILTYFEELTNAEAGKVMKKSKRQIENLAYRAKQALKQTLLQEGFSYEEL